MKKKYVLLFAFISAGVLLSAQQKKAAYRFHSINSLGLVNGDNAASAALQSVNGFKKDSWFAGVGIGIDYYLYRSVPLFADVRYEFGKNKNKFFAYADGGINFSWVQDQFYVQPIIWNGNRSNNFYNGLYTDAGLGYLVGMKKGNGLILSLGYSQKRLKELVRRQDWRTSEWLTDIYRYNLNRVVLKAGWRF
jgi:hypothetical protein